jgi:flagellar biosynthesis/type III secretory pathway chaperone
MRDDSRSRLEELLDLEVEAAHALESLLAEERTALTGGSPQSVEGLAARKIELLGTIETLEGERRKLAAAVEGTGVLSSISERWHKLLEVAKGCRSANEVNGYIINIRQSQIRQLLGVVRGATPLTYGPQGKALAKAQRALAKA